jgi:hypothetical protein
MFAKSQLNSACEQFDGNKQRSTGSIWLFLGADLNSWSLRCLFDQGFSSFIEVYLWILLVYQSQVYSVLVLHLGEIQGVSCLGIQQFSFYLRSSEDA